MFASMQRFGLGFFYGLMIIVSLNVKGTALLNIIINIF